MLLLYDNYYILEFYYGFLKKYCMVLTPIKFSGYRISIPNSGRMARSGGPNIFLFNLNGKIKILCMSLLYGTFLLLLYYGLIYLGQKICI